MLTEAQKKKYAEKFSSQLGKINGMIALEIAAELFVTKEEFDELKEKVYGDKKKVDDKA